MHPSNWKKIIIRKINVYNNLRPINAVLSFRMPYSCFNKLIKKIQEWINLYSSQKRPNLIFLLMLELIQQDFIKIIKWFLNIDEKMTLKVIVLVHWVYGVLLFPQRLPPIRTKYALACNNQVPIITRVRFLNKTIASYM